MLADRRSPVPRQRDRKTHDGEAGITTVVGSTNGTVVFDVSAHHVGFVDEPIEVTVEDGWATSITGGESEREFERYIEENGDENS